MKYCFRVGLIRQGLLHDLSKYSPAEFWQGAKYYEGSRSPNSRAREELGYSTAWMHHKGRNKHHYEYWTDIEPVTKDYQAVPMPTRYMVESVMDRIAASRIYRGRQYTDADPLGYLNRAVETKRLNPTTLAQFTFLLTLLRDRGEQETFRFIRNVVLKGVPFEKWEAASL